MGKAAQATQRAQCPRNRSLGITFGATLIVFFGLGDLDRAWAETDCVTGAKLVKDGAALGDGSAHEEELYRQAISSCPNMPEAYHNLGLVLDKRGDRSGAKEAMEKA